MLFREFNIIAAVAYAAEHAAETTLCTAPLWDEQTEEVQNISMQAVLAIARGETANMGNVFEATARAILEYNGGQGGLALEEMANIGRIPLELELVTADDVADRPIREVVDELLNELAVKRQSDTAGGTVQGGAWQNPRYRALSIADDIRAIDLIGAAKVFEVFIRNGEGGVNEEAAGLLSTAISVAQRESGAGSFGAELDAEHVVALAESYSAFLHEPPQPDAVEAPELETVQ